MKRVAFITLGCKVNQYETNAMAQDFLKKGYEIVEHTEFADIYVINTCTVTNMSDRKSRQMLRRVKELNENAIIVACGCYAQVAKSELEKIEEVDLILGNNEKKNIVKFVEEFGKTNKKELKIEDVMYQKEFVEFGDVVYTEKTRAVIKVQDGCDRFCSYCIIPYARGRVRSRNASSIINEIEEISKKGIKEVVITGIHVASYGKDLKENIRLIDLLEKINNISNIKRIRLSSIEPTIINSDFVNRVTKLKKVCNHFHLSLQSACDETLKRMNRRYTIEEFYKCIDILRKGYNNDVALTTDIIVGFPGETDLEFKETYNNLKNINFSKMHVFKYSPRTGTKAATMKDQVDPKIKEERSKKVIELSNANEIEYIEKYIGKNVEVLFEKIDGNYIWGHTTNYIKVAVEKNKLLENKIYNVKINKRENNELVGTVIEKNRCNDFVVKM